MAPLHIFYIKLIIIAVGNTLVWIGAKNSKLWEKSKKPTILVYVWLLTRLLPFILIYIVIDEMPRGDVPFFWSKATQAYQWKLVYRDFLSFHAPFFAYIIALPLYIWYTPKAIVLLMVVAEGLIVWATYKVYKSLINNVLKDLILYLLLPAPLVMLLLGGQEDIWFWGLALWLIYTAIKNPPCLEAKLGLQFSTGFLLIKASLIFWFVPLLLNIRKKIPFLIALSVVGIIAVGILYWNMGTTFLMPIQHTSNGALTPNLWSVLQPIWGDVENFTQANWIGLILTIIASSAIAYQMRFLPLRYSIPFSFLATFIAMMLFQPSAPGYYAYTFLLALVVELVDWQLSKEIAILLVFNTVLVVQPFLFTYLNSPSYSSLATFQSPLFVLEYIFQWTTILCLLWYLNKVYVQVRRLSSRIG